VSHDVEIYASAAKVHSVYDLDFWPWTLKTLLAIPSHLMNTCGRFH